MQEYNLWTYIDSGADAEGQRKLLLVQQVVYERKLHDAQPLSRARQRHTEQLDCHGLCNRISKLRDQLEQFLLMVCEVPLALAQQRLEQAQSDKNERVAAAVVRARVLRVVQVTDLVQDARCVVVVAVLDQSGEPPGLDL